LTSTARVVPIDADTTQPEQWEHSLAERAERLIRMDDLRRPFGTCMIPNAEDRAITLPQLDDLIAYVEEHCERQAWTASDCRMTSGNRRKLLTPSTVDLYGVVAWVVRPATRQDGCSYVELVAYGPQEPKWFVSHWWGAALKPFVQCLRQHCVDRKMDKHDTAYWICAFAINQNQVESEGSRDPAQSCFRSAMGKSRGTVTVLDTDVVTCSRLWCAYEVYVSVALDFEAGAKQNYMYDCYIALGHGKAVGLTDGLVPADAACAWVKQRREAQFPLAVVERALSAMEVQTAKASVDEDRRRILNSIVGRAEHELDSEPAGDHPRYNDVSRMLRGRFAAGVWTLAFDTPGTEALRAKLEDALRDSGLHRLHLNCSKEAMLKLCLGGLPNQLRELRLMCTPMGLDTPDLRSLCSSLDLAPNLCHLELGLIFDTNACHAAALLLAERIARIPHLATLKLELSWKRAGDVLLITLAQGLSKAAQLENLELQFWNNNIGDSGLAGCAAGLARAPKLSSLALNFVGCSVREDGARALGEGLAAAPNLFDLKLRLKSTGIDDSTAGALGRALGAAERLSSLELKLWDNRIGDFGVGAMAEGLGKLSRVISLDLNLMRNSISIAGVLMFADGIDKAPNLVRLCVEVEEEKALAWEEALRTSLPTLPELIVR